MQRPIRSHTNLRNGYFDHKKNSASPIQFLEATGRRNSLRELLIVHALWTLPYTVRELRGLRGILLP